MENFLVVVSVVVVLAPTGSQYTRHHTKMISWNFTNLPDFHTMFIVWDGVFTWWSYAVPLACELSVVCQICTLPTGTCIWMDSMSCWSFWPATKRKWGILTCEGGTCIHVTANCASACSYVQTRMCLHKVCVPAYISPIHRIASRWLVFR